jgi:hypothetical protein
VHTRAMMRHERPCGFRVPPWLLCMGCACADMYRSCSQSLEGLRLVGVPDFSSLQRKAMASWRAVYFMMQHTAVPEPVREWATQLHHEHRNAWLRHKELLKERMASA